ncbi:hypothetical protein IG631_09633 [Alternaria alternata]|nr:hypothetical protein IG631_09633 [Alternaria alternata]
MSMIATNQKNRFEGCFSFLIRRIRPPVFGTATRPYSSPAGFKTLWSTTRTWRKAVRRIQRECVLSFLDTMYKTPASRHPKLTLVISYEKRLISQIADGLSARIYFPDIQHSPLEVRNQVSATRLRIFWDRVQWVLRGTTVLVLGLMLLAGLETGMMAQLRRTRVVTPV